MNQLNSIILEGNIVNDCVVSEPMPGFLVGKMQIAVERYWKNPDGEKQKDISYFDIESYGNCAENAGKIGIKGRGVRVVGRLKQDSWTDSEQKVHSRVYVVAEHIEYKISKVEKEEEKTA